MFLSRCLQKTSWRLTSRLISTFEVQYKEYGDPMKVLYETTRELGKPKAKEILVNFRASPIHPSDINTVQGVYPIKPPLPCTGGNEGAGYVTACGDSITKFKPGDMVIPNYISTGSWCTNALYREHELVKMNPALPVDEAAFTVLNPSTAYRMLTDFVQLKKGDCVIQNGATSAVGIYVMQIAKILGVNTINLFRERSTSEQTEKTREALKSYGGTMVLTIDELKAATESHEFKSLGPIKLGLNCLGGKPAMITMKCLTKSGVFVSYGGMTRQPMPLPVGPLIFKDVSLRGFWISAWLTQHHDAPQRMEMYETLSNWFIKGQLKLSPYTKIPITDWKKAVDMCMFSDDVPEGLTKKVLLVMPEST